MQVQIQHDPQHHRFTATADGDPAGIAEYVPGEGYLDIVHTEVDPRLGGRGVGSQMVAQVLDQVRADGLQVVATCPFVRAFIDKHPEYADLERRG